jgi:hypothetical protein
MLGGRPCSSRSGSALEVGEAEAAEQVEVVLGEDAGEQTELAAERV